MQTQSMNFTTAVAQPVVAKKPKVEKNLRAWLAESTNAAGKVHEMLAAVPELQAVFTPTMLELARFQNLILKIQRGSSHA